MRLTSIPQIYRNVRRGTEIISVLSKYGLADWLSRSTLGLAPPGAARATAGKLMWGWALG